MPIKIFAAPGDYRDDFAHVEEQTNAWIAEKHPKINDMQASVVCLPVKRESGQFMLTLVVRYEESGS